jgi:hypothetical protein
MRNFRTAVLFTCLACFIGIVFVVACTTTVPTGVIQGVVTIGPIFPGPEIPSETRPVSPDVFSARKVIIYDSSGKNVIQTLDIKQIDQTAKGYYVAQIKPGIYIVDIKKNGIDHAPEVPKAVTVSASQAVVIDINIDTGIR